jgi:hypothetical protein
MKFADDVLSRNAHSRLLVTADFAIGGYRGGIYARMRAHVFLRKFR